MRLIDALRLINEARRGSKPERHVSLVCGFSPLHLETFLAASLQQRAPNDAVRIRTGLFDDLLGNLTRVRVTQDDRGNPEPVAVLVEWPDLDPRLGWRSSGGWSADRSSDVIGNVKAVLERLVQEVARTTDGGRAVCVSLPTLDLPPIAHTPSGMVSRMEAALDVSLAQCGDGLVALKSVRLINRRRLERLSPLAARSDVAATMASGFPYSMTHAAVLADLIAEQLMPAAPKKGLITDLDDTMWRGVIGDLGVDGVSNSQESHTQVHAVYQQLLASLAESGVLLAIASKNDALLALRGLQRSEQLIGADRFFPVEAHWQPKSTSIESILGAWNVAADSVVFVDDSALELAEVKARFPDVECLQFPTKDENAAAALFSTIRDFFAKPNLLDEDRLRLDSIRNSASLRSAMARPDDDAVDFLASTEAELTFEFSTASADERAFELINKTNQFNLNGRRLSPVEWSSSLSHAGQWKVTVSYRDKFGPLGRIAVILVDVQERKASVTSWVLSCRAFSRRIEHQSLAVLFSRFDVDEIVLDYIGTERNGPTREFLTQYLGDDSWPSTIAISRDMFLKHSPTLHHAVHVIEGARRS